MTARIALLTRSGCDLCEEMLAELQLFTAGRDVAIELVDVDADVTLKTRFGHQIPVLLLDGEPVCHGHFDVAEVERLLRSR
jgi:glutaredoxin